MQWKLGVRLAVIAGSRLKLASGVLYGMASWLEVIHDLVVISDLVG